MTVSAADNLRRIRLMRRPIHVWEVQAANDAADLLDAIAALHQKCDHHRFAMVDRTHCDACGHDWPCPTARLLQGEGE